MLAEGSQMFSHRSQHHNALPPS